MLADAPVSPDRLHALGLSPAEAKSYLALLRLGTVGAKAVGEATGVTRTGAYSALRALAERGLVEAGTGYGARFRAVAPEQAFPTLVEHRREAATREVEELEVSVKDLVRDLSRLAQDTPLAAEEVVEVIRNPRVMSERFDRLQLEAREEIATVVKAPIVTSGDPNPSQDVALATGVRVRGLYEGAVLDHPEIRPYLRTWVEAGEEARIYPGELPLKFAVFDSRTALLPLETPDDVYPFTTLVVRHRALGAALRLLYEFLWRESEPFVLS